MCSVMRAEKARCRVMTYNHLYHISLLNPHRSQLYGITNSHTYHTLAVRFVCDGNLDNFAFIIFCRS